MRDGGKGEMNNEPVAIRYDFDGYGYQYMDSGSGSDWQTRVDGELLYADPVKELPTKEDEYWLMVEMLRAKVKEQQAEIESLKKEAALQRLSDFTQEAEALKAHPVKELHLSLQKSKQTGELLAVTYTDDEHRIVEVLWQRPPAFARAILRKAGEK
jgi:hypothetical protein